MALTAFTTTVFGFLKQQQVVLVIHMRFFSNVTSLTRNYRNNIFFNGCSNSGGTGRHYAIQVRGSGVFIVLPPEMP